MRRTFLLEGPWTMTLAFFCPGRIGDCWDCIACSLAVGSLGNALANLTRPSTKV